MYSAPFFIANMTSLRLRVSARKRREGRNRGALSDAHTTDRVTQCLRVSARKRRNRGALSDAHTTDRVTQCLRVSARKRRDEGALSDAHTTDRTLRLCAQKEG